MVITVCVCMCVSTIFNLASKLQKYYHRKFALNTLGAALLFGDATASTHWQIEICSFMATWEFKDTQQNLKVIGRNITNIKMIWFDGFTVIKDTRIIYSNYFLLIKYITIGPIDQMEKCFIQMVIFREIYLFNLFFFGGGAF